MFNNIATQAILEYLEESDVPELYWPRHRFEEVCFSRWAAEELLNAILDHPLVSAEDTIEEFAIKMEIYFSLSVGKDAERIFSIAAKTAWEIFDSIQHLKTHEILKGETV